MPKWDLFKEFISIQEKINSVLDEVITEKWDYDAGITYGVWSPPVDIYETEDGVVMKAELPGMAEDDFDVRVKGDAVILVGERRFDKNLKEESYIRMERPYGTFRRIFKIPANVDKKKIEIYYKEGVLEIIMSKSIDSMIYR